MTNKVPHMDERSINILRDVLLLTPKGKEALQILLHGMGYFSIVETEETQILKNHATRLVSLLGPKDGSLFASNVINALDTSYTMEFKTSKKENK